MDFSDTDLFKLSFLNKRKDLIKKLASIGVFSINDLINYFPYKYIDKRNYKTIADLRKNSLKNIDINYHSIGRVKNIKLILKGNRSIVHHILEDNTASIRVLWFNSEYVLKKIKEDDILIFSGPLYKNRLVNPTISKVDSDEDIKKFARIEAVYHETKYIKSSLISKLIEEVFEKGLFTPVNEYLDDNLMRTEKLIDINQAYRLIHLPSTQEDIQKARERLAFGEIYLIIKKAKELKQRILTLRSPRIQIQGDIHNKIESLLPFKLTESQIKAIQEIYQDLQKDSPMHRLLNGDVGSGKTVVAAFAAAQVLANNMQVVFMVPTAILVSQHYAFLSDLLGKLGFRVSYLTGQIKSKRDLTTRFISLASDDCYSEIIVGTHALLYRPELFFNVGLVIIDEQHKFGVEQRNFLESLKSFKDNLTPHVLSMSATPIPRTLALTLYGDLQVSFMKRPIGRKAVITKVIYSQEEENQMYQWIYNEIKTKNVQVFVVCPMIQSTSKLGLRSAIQEYQRIKNRFSDLVVGLLHGRMKDKEKQQVVENFRKNQISVLVSTSIIEVGVDISNANIVVIENAERFGLAQLHQIRGRVGRSNNQGYCFVKHSNYEYSERLEFFAQNDDGFVIAEYDLKLRGPGEVYGTEQSGIPDLKIASINDIDLINRVKSALDREPDGIEGSEANDAYKLSPLQLF